MPPPRPNSRSLWLGVILAFALLLGAYVVFFTIASRHPIDEVPLVTAPPH